MTTTYRSDARARLYRVTFLHRRLHRLCDAVASLTVTEPFCTLNQIAAHLSISHQQVSNLVREAVLLGYLTAHREHPTRPYLIARTDKALPPEPSPPPAEPPALPVHAPIAQRSNGNSNGSNSAAYHPSPPLVDSDRELLASLSSLLLAMIRQAEHDVVDANGYAHDARLFLKDLKTGRVPDWMRSVVLAASESAARPVHEPYAPQIDAAPHRASDHTAASARYAD